MIFVNLIEYGNIFTPINWKSLQSYDSSIFQIKSKRKISIANPSNKNFYQNTDASILERLSNKERTKHEVNLLITREPLEDNWYLRVLDRNTAILSLYETGDILDSQNIPIENFILKAVFKMSVTHERFGELTPDIYNIAHEEIRGCLFDMNYNKGDLIHNTNKPIICSSCKFQLEEADLPDNFLKNVERHLQKLNKSTYYLISDFIKCRPLLSIFLGACLTVILNIASSIICNNFTNWLSNFYSLLNWD